MGIWRLIQACTLAGALVACGSDEASSTGGSGATGDGGGGPSGSGAGPASGSGGSSTSTATGASGGGGGSGATGGATTSSTGTGGGGGTTNVDPSNGMGGPIVAGQQGTTPLGAIIRMPAGYDPATLASPVVWLFNEELPQWSAIADMDSIVLVDLDEYNDTNAIVAKLNETQTILETQYNVDKARYYWAGWSAGGNIVVIAASQNQELVAGTLVFPGTGGSIAQPYMQQNPGHKIRMYYACGDQDPNYAWMVVENEANVFGSYGYTTTFEKAVGSAHYIDESIYKVRESGWAWIKGFNLKN